LTAKLKIENTVKYTSEIIVKVPTYCSEEELAEHIEALKKKINSTDDFNQIVIVIEDYGFDIEETLTGFPNHPDIIASGIVDYEVNKGEY